MCAKACEVVARVYKLIGRGIDGASESAAVCEATTNGRELGVLLLSEQEPGQALIDGRLLDGEVVVEGVGDAAGEGPGRVASS